MVALEEGSTLRDTHSPKQGLSESQGSNVNCFEQDVQVVPMQYTDFRRGADTFHRAFLNDSLMKYFAAADTAPFREARRKIGYYLMFNSGIRQRRMLTVNNGAAVMHYQGPGDVIYRSRWERAVLGILNKFQTKELKKRLKEYDQKGRAMVQDAFGEKVAGMYEVQAIATAPEAQGQGYGSALITTVTDLGDIEGHDVWLYTVDAYPFYEYLGFSMIRTALMGVDNPEWNGTPVTIRLMYRPAKGWGHSEEKVDIMTADSV
ncbi:hypothetical protein C8Q78DRAFT_1002778 [Trametes maxima]|nr:hypothetical protein C8Q78DRAFT_1002778 [Trametes maxima]